MKSIKPTASHPKTNEVILQLITKHLSRESVALDFGAERGYMSQKVGQYLEGNNQEPRKYPYACDIDSDAYEYEGIHCQRIQDNSDIPFHNDFFDVVYSIEVLEHMPRPYDFFQQCYQKLKPGGRLIFSTPNVLNFQSRLRFLLTGYHEMFGPLSIQEKNAGRLCGHIMPLSYSNYHYGLRKSGFNQIEFHVDRKKRGALIPALLLYPLLKWSSYRADKRLQRYDTEVANENKGVVPFVNSLDMLASRSCIIVAQKPY
ncbi:hypothetical protein AB835_08120 [Candidatus Endobugula sertula]|uniref:Methyltransferase type 11 domain-containing protein n=1 Tax=Candidatus Endobugula sertula TaxID=62101 RepID=A0A1D2QPQ5_9GAMM|nr:hypothetical protein AB835_08120 [Candidatus Endobugula sertula]